MDPEAQESAVDTEAETTSSPDVTEGVSSSDTAAEEQEHDLETAEAIQEAFLKEYGDPTEAEEEEPSEDDAEPETAEAERKEAPEEEAQGDESHGDDKHRLSDEEFKALSENARMRIGELNARAKKAERQLREFEAELQTSRQAVERVNELENFVKEYNVEPQNVGLAFGMMAKLSTGDFQGFLNDIEPFYQYARQASGQTLPQDIQSQVDDGYLTEDAAKELVRARISQERVQAENQRLLEQQRQAQTQTQAQRQVQAIQQAVNAREQELKSSDPDYARISDAVKRNMEFALRNGAVPKTPEQALQMVNQAYEMAKAAAPKAPPRATPRRPTATTVARGAQAPASTKDAIIGALEGYAPSR